MMLRMLAFLLLVTAMTALAHAWLARRLAAPLSAPQRRLVHGLAVASALAMPLIFAASRVLLADDPGSPLAILAFVHLGFFSLLFSVVAAADLVRLALGLLDRLAGGAPSKALLPADPSRRQALASGLNLSLVGLAGAQSAAGFLGNRRPLKVVEVEVPIPELHPDLDGLRIVQLSDVHVGPLISGDFVREVVELSNGLRPDLVAITGDLVDGSVDQLRNHTQPLSELKSTYGTFFCTGNHEYYSGAEEWCRECQRLGMVVLNNANRTLQVGAARLQVVGVTDRRAGDILPSHRSDLGKALAGAPPADFRLLLAHQPGSVREAPAGEIDLQLSGHTHGGQYFPGTVLVHLAHPYVRDLHLHEGRTWIYVSCGTGWWGPPFRLGSEAEVTLLRLVRA